VELIKALTEVFRWVALPKRQTTTVAIPVALDFLYIPAHLPKAKNGTKGGDDGSICEQQHGFLRTAMMGSDNSVIVGIARSAGGGIINVEQQIVMLNIQRYLAFSDGT
jgi:hypothetical protein